MSFEQRIREQLLKEQEERKNRERSGKWNPSRFGRCFRHQYYSRSNEPESNPPDVDFLKRLKLGKLIHEYAQSFYPERECEVKVEKEDILGYCDNLSGIPVDFKSVADWEYKKIISPAYNIEKDKITNCLQLSIYAWITGHSHARLIFINTKNLHSKEFDVRVDHFIPLIEEELKILRGYWERKELPPAKPRAYNGKDCDYCCYKDTCLKTQNKNV